MVESYDSRQICPDHADLKTLGDWAAHTTLSCLSSFSGFNFCAQNLVGCTTEMGATLSIRPCPCVCWCGALEKDDENLLHGTGIVICPVQYVYMYYCAACGMCHAGSIRAAI